jgi:hypothetical protein
MIETSTSGRCRVERHSCPYHEERRYSVKEGQSPGSLRFYSFLQSGEPRLVECHKQ